jgi:hypothetical protein
MHEHYRKTSVYIENKKKTMEKAETIGNVHPMG